VDTERQRTDARRAAHRLAEAESRFDGVFEANATGMALTAPDGRFLAVNPALCRFLGRDAETLLRSSVQEVTHNDDLEADVQQGERLLSGEINSFQQSKRYILPNGGIVWGLLTISASRDADGVPVHYVSQVQDITARKTSEAELQRYAAQLQALSEQDPLTGLLNRTAFEVALAEELSVFKAGGSRCGALLIVIDGDDAAVAVAADALGRASRSEDRVAYLGHGELAVLFSGIDGRTVAEIVERIGVALGRSGHRRSYAAAQRGEGVGGLLQRLRAQLPEPAKPAPGATAWQGPEGIARLLELARTQLGMPLSFLTRIANDDYVFMRFAGEPAQLGVAEGDTMPLSDSYCERMLDGRIPSIIPDVTADPHTRVLELTDQLGLRAYAGVPVRLRSGQIYGTMCVVDTRAHPELSERHAELLRFLSALTAELIEDETEQSAAQRVRAGAASVRTLLVALQARDYYTSAHSKQVVELASAVAWRLGLDEDATRDVEQVALLHDVGKVGIPDAVLQKQGPLDDQEWELMRQHPIVGEHIIAGTPGLSHLAPAMRAEHEHWDGGGYPDGLAGETIPLASRITLACDALNAMTSDRPYRSAMTFERAREELRSCAGTEFDPRAVEALLAEVSPPPT
jgi:PAS domain S-box-containing protein